MSATTRWGRSPARLGGALGLLYLPFLWFGYGTDVDITNLRRSGRAILDGSYVVSRPPGAVVNETVTGILDRVGGSTLVNVGSAIAAVVTLVFLGRVVERLHGANAGRVAVLVLGLQPWFWVGATSLGDFVYVLAFLMAGIDSCQRDRRIVAGLLFGLAIGNRMSAVLLVGAYLLAELTGIPDRAPADQAPADQASTDQAPPDRATTRPWAAVLRSAAVASTVGIAAFIPPWLQFDRTLDFFQNQFQTGSITTLVGRWAVKNIAFFGVPLLVVGVARLGVFTGALRQFRESVLVRFAVYAGVVTEVLFLRLPFKPIHLLPMALVVAVLVAISPRRTAASVWLVVGAQVLLAFGSIALAEPDRVNAATDARFDPQPAWGVVVNELRCRIDPPYEGSWPELDTPAADAAAQAVFVCQGRSWRVG